MEISWSKGWHGVGKELESADLWITWFRSDSYSQLLLSKPELEFKIAVTSCRVDD
jgi:hypothetical protein